MKSNNRRIKLIVNPNSQRLKVNLLLTSIISRFVKNGYEIDLYKTVGGGDAIEVARQAVDSEEFGIVVAGGGDGTVNEVINGLMPNPIQMGILPLGTSNGLARELNIPLNPLKSVDAMINGLSAKIDVGIANGRYFGLMLGCGFDALAIENTNLLLKRFTGKYAYAISGLKKLYKYKSHRIQLVVDGKRILEDALFVVVSNTKLYGGKYVLTPDAKCDDGIFDVFMYTGDRLFGFISFMLKVISHKKLDSPNTNLFQAKNLLIYSTGRVPYQADGDVFGELPVQVQVFPSAIEILGANPHKSQEE